MAKRPFYCSCIPTNNIPVFRVQKESDKSCIKTLHRNMLLPFSAIPEFPSTAEFSELAAKQKSLSKRSEIKKQHTDSSSSEESDSDQPESDYSVPRYIIPQKRDRTSFQKVVKSTVPDLSSGVLNTSTSDLQPTVPDTVSSVHSDSMHFTDNVENSQSNPLTDSRQTISSFLNDSTQSISGANESQSSFPVQTPASVHVNRSTRTIFPLDNIWGVVNYQQSVLEPDSTQVFDFCFIFFSR